jgi:RimJ/RimL family protein N-acetyltransferase
MFESAQKKWKVRAFKAWDAIPMVEGINSSRIAQDTSIELPWTIDNAKWWIDFVQDCANQNPVPEVHFAIEVDGNLAGSIGLVNIDCHKAELGYWLSDRYAGNGIMTEVVTKILDYAYQKLGLVRVYAPIFKHNQASIRILEKNGFECEGVLKAYFKKHNKYVDALCYAKVCM